MFKKITNERGFSALQFTDCSAAPCSVSQSSAICEYGSDEDIKSAFENPGSSMIYLGVDDANPMVLARDAEKYGIKTDEKVGWVPYPVPPGVSLRTHMHLSRKQTQELITVLQSWLDTGNMPETE